MRSLAGLVLALLTSLLTTLLATPPSQATPSPTPSRDTTMELRDAWLATDARSARGDGAGRTAARPSDPADGSGDFFWDPAAPREQLCGASVCVHYVTTTSDAPPLVSSDGVVPDWVRRNLGVAELSLARMGELGYPPVPADDGRGGTAQFDVYLADISRAGLYGYCAPEDAVPGAPGRASSYCVFDNDFTGFPMPPDESLRVTAAHELFHAVQFGLDVREDVWFMESTATWMEEQVADDVDDNRQYLPAGQLGHRQVPLDHASAGLGIYGNWILFQFLAQRYGTDAVRQIWDLAAVGPDARNRFSVQAVRRFVESRNDSFPTVYAAFALANLSPRRGYDEGRTYRTEELDAAVRLGAGRSSWRDRRVAVPHLTSRAFAFRPRAATPGGARLRLSVVAARPAGPAATVQVHLSSGRIATLPIRLRKGHGSRVVKFAGSRVRKVVLVVANASTRYACGQRTHYACQGRPLDDRQRFDVAASVVRARR